MANQSSLEALRADLIRRGLPRRYVRRVVDELADHQEDLMAECSGAADAKLGDMAALAEQIVAEFRASRFAGRHPFLVFVVAPIPLVILAWMLVLVGFGLLSMLIEPMASLTERNLGALAIYHGLRFVPFAITALILCRLAYRCGRREWAFFSCCLVALLAGSLLADLKLHVGSEEGHIWFGTMFQTPGIALRSWAAAGRQVMQMLVPLAIAAGFALRFARRQRLALQTI
jgi:hypothetical protein